MQADILRRHQTAGAIIRIVQIAVDQRALIFGCFFEDLIYQIGRKLLQNIDFIVEVELLYDVTQLRIRNAVHNLELVIRRQVRKNLNRNVLWQQAVNNHRLLDQFRLIQEFLEHFRDIGIVVLEQFILGKEVLLLIQKLKNLLQRLLHRLVEIH